MGAQRGGCLTVSQQSTVFVEVSQMEGLQSEAGRGLSAPGACEDPLDRVPQNLLPTHWLF